MRKLTAIFITAIEHTEGINKLALICGDSTEDYFITTGFDTVAECWDYAKCLAKGFDLDEDCISSDVFDIENHPEDYPERKGHLTRIK
jgi:WD40 repeat protein